MPEIRFALSRGFAVSGLFLGRFTQGGRALGIALDPGLISGTTSGVLSLLRCRQFLCSMRSFAAQNKFSCLWCISRSHTFNHPRKPRPL